MEKSLILDHRVKISLVHKYSPNYPSCESTCEQFDFRNILLGLRLARMDDLESAKQEGTVRNVLAQYWGELAAKGVFFRGIHDGFSGSQVFEVILPAGARFFLKQWPTVGPSYSRLTQIHQVLVGLEVLRQTDELALLTQFPKPIENSHARTITVENDRLWELSNCIPGKPVQPEAVTRLEVNRAMQVIARVHLAMKLVGSGRQDEFGAASIGKSPGLMKRQAKLASLVSNWQKLSSSVRDARLPQPLQSQCESLLHVALPSAFALQRSTGWDQIRLPLQLCLRDCWYAHLFFLESQVSGIIDFGSIQVDNVATDLARLLRSWFAPDETDFTDALNAYHEIRPLTDNEREAFTWFDRTSRVLSAFQWIEWLAIGRREFEDRNSVSARLDFVLARLPKAGGSGID